MSKPKIIIFTTDLYKGGIASASAKYANSLAKEFEVCMIVWDDLPINLRLPKGIRLYQINCPLGANFGKTKKEILKRKIFRLLLIPYAIIQFWVLLRKEKPSHVFSLGYLPNLASLLISSTRKVKTIISERTFPGRDLEKSGIKGKLVIGLSKRLYQRANLVLTPSLELAKHIEVTYTIPKDRIVGISNFFDLERIAKQATIDLPKEHQSIFESNVIINCGRLSRQKGQWFLIRAAAPILLKNKDWKLVFLGDGEMQNELTELSIKLGVEKQVYFLGNVNNPYQYISTSKLFVFPSLWEGFPNALVEAMACKAPVIAADCPTGPKEILIDNNYPSSYFIDQLPNKIFTDEPLIKQERDLQQAILRLIENKEERKTLSKKASTIAQLYSKQVVEQELFKCIREMKK